MQLEVELLHPCICASSVLGILKVLAGFASAVQHRSSYSLVLWELSGEMRSDSLSSPYVLGIGKFRLILRSSVASSLRPVPVLPAVLLARRGGGPGLPSEWWDVRESGWAAWPGKTVTPASQHRLA